MLLMPHVSPNARQWSIVHVGYARVWFALAMYISCCLSQFHSRWEANANPISGGIQVLGLCIHFNQNDSFLVILCTLTHTSDRFSETNCDVKTCVRNVERPLKI